MAITFLNISKAMSSAIPVPAYKQQTREVNRDTLLLREFDTALDTQPLQRQEIGIYGQPMFHQLASELQ